MLILPRLLEIPTPLKLLPFASTMILMIIIPILQTNIAYTDKNLDNIKWS